jgi:hypothetical protein
MNSDLTLLIPAKFESESLPIFLEELKKYDYKKLVVLDETDFSTIDVVKNLMMLKYFIKETLDMEMRS